MTTMEVFTIVAGLCLFLYGIRLITKNLQLLAGNSLKILIGKLTARKRAGFLVGVLTAFCLQSSGAVVLMLLGLANAGLIALAQSLPIILGAGVGSTLTVQILAFKLYTFAPIVLTLGFILLYFPKPGRLQYTGFVIFSFGIMLLGMALIRQGAAPLQSQPAIGEVLKLFEGAPFWIVILGFMLTTVFQSSTAVLGLMLTLAFSGVINEHIAIPVVIGANVGSCMMGLIGAIGSKRKAKEMVWSQLIMKVIVGSLLFIFLPFYMQFVAMLGGDVARQIANAHTLFDIIMAIMFLPFVVPFSKLLQRLYPKAKDDNKFAPMYLDESTLDTPAVAMGQAVREVLRMGDLVSQMLSDWGEIFHDNDAKKLDDLVDFDDMVDTLQIEVTRFLTRLSMDKLDKASAQWSFALVSIALELEHIGDVISKDLAPNARKKIEVGYYFSDQGFLEILAYHRKVLNHLNATIAAIPLRDAKVAHELVQTTKALAVDQRNYYRLHLERLRLGVRETQETSTLHIDIIGDLNKINMHISYIAYNLTP